MSNSFIIRNAERGHDMITSDGSRSSYIAGHPDGFVTRASSFNFNQYQGGRPGFGPVRVFGDEIFHGAGCGYNMHPHHNFVICAFVFEGELTHINTAGTGMVDRLQAGDYYVFSAGSGGKHSELPSAVVVNVATQARAAACSICFANRSASSVNRATY
jgi:redox-sensitive bicupin YhaK (pirin superfamily)